MIVSMDLSADELIERVAQVSHATYLLQAVRDQGTKRLQDITVPVIPEIPDTPERREDLALAQEWLDAVLSGKSLEEFSDKPGHHPTDHDRERARNTVAELRRLDLVLRDQPVPGG
jgi:hypothetical protein